MSSVITNTDLGELSNNSFSTIKESIVKANQNSELIINDIEFEYITYGRARIRSNNPNFTGSVDITFNPRHLDLSSVISNTDLGIIDDNSTRSIINAILKTNNNFFWILASHFTTNFDIENDLNVRITTPTSAVITSNNHNFFGLINVCFRINLSSVISNTDLGIIRLLA